jgi:colanic acid biosynthesis glycosyl transferase WcaI
MKILIHTQYYPPEMGAPQARLSELARGLKRRGFEVTVLTAMPNYPTGKIYPGYRGIFQIEEIDSIKVIRTAIFPSQKAAFLPRLFSYFSFVVSSFLLGLKSIGTPDVIITESPPLFLGISGYLLSRLCKSRWIFNVSDLWPESAVQLGIVRRGGLVHKISSALETYFYRKAWAVTGQSATILEDIHRRFPQMVSFHLSNGVDPDRFCPNGNNHPWRKQMGLDGCTIALYAGLHGLAQGLEQILLASEELNDLENLRILLIGDGPEKQSLQNHACKMNLSNVNFLDALPHKEMPGVISAADICIVPLKTDLTGAVPSKLYEAMGCGKPVVLVADGEAARIVSDAQCGIVVKPGDKRGLATALRYLSLHGEERERMGWAGRQAVLMKYSRETIIERFAKFLLSEN